MERKVISGVHPPHGWKTDQRLVGRCQCGHRGRPEHEMPTSCRRLHDVQGGGLLLCVHAAA